MKRECFSTSFANKKFEEFIYIVKKYALNCIIDIRESTEMDGDFFKKENIKKKLNSIGMYYIYMGDYFKLSEKDTDFQNYIRKDTFEEGIKRIISGINKGFKIAIVDNDNEAIVSKRTVLIGYGLSKHNITVNYEGSQGDLKTQEEISKELYNKNKIKLIKKVSELTINSIMKNVDLDMDESDFKNEMMEEAYSMAYNDIINRK
ncbi:MAG: DUF488 family protein [Clostridium sp.]|nr:DUF488 family protein [Clostridium sp.]